MANPRTTLKQSDLTRYAKALRAAGIAEWRVEVLPTGKHIIIAGKVVDAEGGRWMPWRKHSPEGYFFFYGMRRVSSLYQANFLKGLLFPASRGGGALFVLKRKASANNRLLPGTGNPDAYNLLFPN